MVDIDYSRKTMIMVSLLLAGTVIGGSVSYLYVNSGNVSSQQAGEKLVSTLEKQSGQDLELVRVQDQSGLYKVDVKNSNDQLQTFYVTKDGRRIATQLGDLDRISRTVDAQREFNQCLNDRNVVLYGNATQQRTLLQIQLLGGAQSVSGYYQDVNNQQTLAQAANRGVQQVPAFYYNGSVLQGINQLNAVEEFTGCSYPLN